VSITGTPTTLPPVANFFASTTTPFVGDVVTFTDNSTNAPTSWSWTFTPSTVQYMNGTNSGSQHPQVKFNAAGSYTVSLIATNAGGSDTETKNNYITASVPIYSLDLKAYLEGPFNGTGMDASLQALIPQNQPFNMVPWNYGGTEYVGSLPNPNVVEWILVDVREAASAALATGATSIAQQAAFILSDGSVVGLDGSSNLTFQSVVTQNIYVVLWQRNHLGILSNNALVQAEGVYSYDFTTGVNQVYGGLAGHKELATGKWGMFSGDGDRSGTIEIEDKSDSWESEAGEAGYIFTDYNLDGQSNNIDKDEYWLPNIGKGTMVP
jgi:PKD repeat protein